MKKAVQWPISLGSKKLIKIKMQINQMKRMEKTPPDLCIANIKIRVPA